jgi:magnesium-transporting ATPase (P-type)
MSVNGEKVLVNILGHVTPFLLLDSFEFSSERARMSVIVLDPRDGDIKVLTKGADQKMYKLLNEESRSSRVWSSTENGLKQFAGFGLRTLVCGMKVLSEEQYVAWASEYAKAKANVERREELVAHWQNEIEQGLTYVGTTAIEDRLQDGVPECISTLLAAGLKIWILTGDKVETAINIARSCSLVTPSMDSAGLLELIVDDKLSDEEALKSTQAQLAVALKRVEQEAGHLPAGQASDSLAIVVSGLALTHIFSVVRDERGREILYENLSATQRREADVLRDQFMIVASRCSAVVCCRVSPNQKAEVVSLVKNKQPDLITLAIGDGANDVSMIKTAHIGVGISGLEGLQAVMASDYSIAQVSWNHTAGKQRRSSTALRSGV